MSTFLYHHGVKGQQWGVLNGPPYPIDKKNHRTTIRKGYSFGRLTSKDESESKGHAYANYSKFDRHRYKGFFGANIRRRDKTNDVYEITLKAKQNMVSPSQKERIDTFLELHKNDPRISKELAAYAKSNWHKATPLPQKFYELNYAHMSGENLVKKAYKDFASSLGANEYIRNEYFKALKKKGFTFVQDDLDANKFGKYPVIIFDRSESTEYSGRTKVSKEESKKIWREEGTFLKRKYKN